MEVGKFIGKLFVVTLGMLLIQFEPASCMGDKEFVQHGLVKEFKLRMNKERLSPNNSQLVEFVREKHLVFPSIQKYNLKTRIKKDPSKGLVQEVRQLLRKMGKGVFVECGAYDGEYTSNTLWLERNKGWTGLLIEPDPKTFKLLKKKNRKAFLANVCLSSQAHPEELTLYRKNRNNGLGNSLINDREKGLSNEDKVVVQCVPLETLLLASGLGKIDLFSLDVEGYELEILKGLDFTKLGVKIFFIEYKHLPKNGEQVLYDLMKEKGYKLYRKLRLDYIYVHTSLIDE